MSILHSLSLANIDFEATKGVSFMNNIVIEYIGYIEHVTIIKARYAKQAFKPLTTVS